MDLAIHQHITDCSFLHAIWEAVFAVPSISYAGNSYIEQRQALFTSPLRRILRCFRMRYFPMTSMIQLNNVVTQIQLIPVELEGWAG